MSDEPAADRLPVLTRVRCLDCGLAYAKPSKGGTVDQNPGCPRCGYIGWVHAAVEVTPATGVQPRHSVADLRRAPASQRR